MRYYTYFLLLIFVISGSRFININLNEDYINLIRILKTLIIVYPLIYFTSYIDKRDYYYLLLTALIGFIFLLFSDSFLWIQVVLLGLSTTVYSKELLKINKKILIYFIFISMAVISSIDYIFNSGNFIITTYYSREKVLMGFNHPKILSELLLFIFIIINFSKNLNLKLYFNFVVLILIYLIDSRNALLFIINFIILNYLFNKNYKNLVALYITIILLIFILLIIIYPEIMNTVMSGRLFEIYRHDNINLFFGSLDDYINTNNLLSRYNTDNGILDLFIQIGIIPALFIIFYLLDITIKISKVFIGKLNCASIFISYILYNLNDSALFSSGNLLNFIVFSILCLSLNKYYLQNEKNINNR